MAWLTHARAVLGDRAAAAGLLTRLERLARQRYVPPYHLAIAHTGLGDIEAAFAALERAAEDRDPLLAERRRRSALRPAAWRSALRGAHFADRIVGVLRRSYDCAPFRKNGPRCGPSLYNPFMTDLGGTITLGGELTVHRLGFGAMRLTGPGIFGAPANREECRRVLRRATELGVDFIDTADSYGPNVSEEIIAETLHPYQPGLAIATKAGFLRPGPHQWKVNGDPKRLRAACEGSLKRLRVDRIDLFQLHRIDPDVPEADQFGLLDALRREGKIRLIGLSEVGVPAIERARRTLPIASVQNKYNVADRSYDDVVEYCERAGIAFIPWYPLGAGALTDNAALTRVAIKHRATPMQVAIAWLLARSRLMLPIPGTSSVAHLEENVAAAQVRLDVEDSDELARFSPQG